MKKSQSVISSICWVARGVAKEVPTRIKLSEEELATLLEQRDPEELSEMLETTHLGNTEGQVNNSSGKKSSPVDTELEKEFNMDDYSDDDSDDDSDNKGGKRSSGNPSLGMQGLSMFSKASEDQYITLPNLDEMDMEDLIVQDTDNLIVVGQTEDEYSRIEVSLYEEEEDNHYVHHELGLSGVPLCLEWLGYNIDEPGTRGNFVALGQMLPIIEIWDLDLIDTMEPVGALGQLPAIPSHIAKSQSKTKKLLSLGLAYAGMDTSQTHTDAVLSLSANKINTQILASGSADGTVKVWDLSTGNCAFDFRHHTDKVQKVSWHPTEAPVILTGSYDRSLCVFDSRTKVSAKADTTHFTVDSDIESAIWNHFQPTSFLASTEAGNVHCFDIRNNKAPVYTISAHEKAVCAISLSKHIPGCLITASADKSIKVWDIEHNIPKFVYTKNLDIGPIYAAEFSPDSPFILAAGGGMGDLKVYNLSAPIIVQKTFKKRLIAAKKQFKL